MITQAFLNLYPTSHKLKEIIDKEKNDIKWNFTKILIDKNGNIVKRFEPTAKLEAVKEAIKEVL